MRSSRKGDHAGATPAGRSISPPHDGRVAQSAEAIDLKSMSCGCKSRRGFHFDRQPFFLFRTNAVGSETTEPATGPARRRRLLSGRSRPTSGMGSMSPRLRQFRLRPHRLCSRTSGFQSDKPGASPGGDASFPHHSQSFLFQPFARQPGREILLVKVCPRQTKQVRVPPGPPNLRGRKLSPIFSARSMCLFRSNDPAARQGVTSATNRVVAGSNPARSSPDAPVAQW